MEWLIGCFAVLAVAALFNEYLLTSTREDRKAQYHYAALMGAIENATLEELIAADAYLTEQLKNS